MNNNKLYLLASIIWFCITGGYIAVLFVDFYYGYTTQWLAVLHMLAVGGSLLAAVVNLKRYRRGTSYGKQQEE